jgi:hypothetical protein
LFLILFSFNIQYVIGQNNELDKLQFSNLDEQGKWSYTFQVGWATNIDFTVNSTSQGYKFDDTSTGIDSRFHSYDSREKISELEGDQANNYLVTIRNQSSGLTLTTGVIHDKREQRPNTHRNTFKYEKGGLSPVVLLGVQHDFSSALFQPISVQLKAGGFLSFNKIVAALINNSNKTKYTANNHNRTFSGGGVVAMGVISYQYSISEAVSVSFLINGTMMSGKAVTYATAFNEITEKDSGGKLSVSYSSVSLGPSLGFTLIK